MRVIERTGNLHKKHPFYGLSRTEINSNPQQDNEPLKKLKEKNYITQNTSWLEIGTQKAPNVYNTSTAQYCGYVGLRYRHDFRRVISVHCVSDSAAPSIYHIVEYARHKIALSSLIYGFMLGKPDTRVGRSTLSFQCRSAKSAQPVLLGPE